MKKNLSTIILILIFFIGMSLLLYPTLSDYWNSFHQSRAISNYAEAVVDIDDEKYSQILNSALLYNQEMSGHGVSLTLSEEELERYESELRITDRGIMGYIEIPSINCSLPIYHGTDETILQTAVGHIAGTSLPVGGESTHCVLSGHRGLPSAKLFTDLDQLIEGDTFLIRILDETLTYEVDQINIVLPYETDLLKIEPGKDLCTLITCTPYGINTHRLLVRGHRIDTINKVEIRVTADAQQIETMIVAPIVAIPMLLILFIILIISTSKKKQQ